MINKIGGYTPSQNKNSNKSQTPFGQVKYNINGKEGTLSNFSDELDIMLDLVQKSEKGKFSEENVDTFVVNPETTDSYPSIVMSDSIGKIQIIKDYKNDTVGTILSKTFDKLVENIKKMNNTGS